MKKKILSGIVLILLFFILGAGGYLYYLFAAANVTRSGKLFIPTGARYQQLIDSLQPFLNHQKTFLLAARMKQLPVHIHSGRYTITKDMSNNRLINLLRSGKQDDIAIRIGNYSSIEQLAGRVAPYLECDSQEIVSGIRQAGYTQDIDSDAWLYFFIPNTYNFHWDISGRDFAQKMKGYFDKFWTPERLAAAKERRLSPLQVTILASIVQLESAHPDEQPRVARLYLNRLERNMKLDADPTVIFAMRKAYGWDLKVNRVYYKNLLIPSPYNTYRNRGLPPGPICMPNASAVDAVLHPADHDYLYMVAAPDHPGYHLFARTLAEQERHAQQYRQWIDSVQQQQ